MLLNSKYKLKVFISSKCGDNDKYDKVRSELKSVIEATNVADVYLFEQEGASTLSAENHYTWNLVDSDVCIFLIDNKDGVPRGVQAEIDVVKRHKKKALFCFCDENSTEKTVLEKSLMGATYAKSKTVHSFAELSSCGVQWLVDDILNIYHNYCYDRLTPITQDYEDVQEKIEIVDAATPPFQPVIPKLIVKEIDGTSDYIYKFIVEKTADRPSARVKHTGEIDEWGIRFLRVLCEHCPIEQFNAGLFLEVLRKYQEDKFLDVVRMRWNAIQMYFQGDILKCIWYLESASKLSKETQQPAWVQNDILIDLRNMQIEKDNISNVMTTSEAQKELSNSSEEVYYPVLDRILRSVNEKYIDELYKERIKSAYAITFSNEIVQLCESLASSLVIAMYNGSLTHVLGFYDEIKHLLFYLCSKYGDWCFRRNLLKVIVFCGKQKEAESIERAYPEILNRMTSEDAKMIMDFTENNTIEYKRKTSLIIAFGKVGYFLDEQSYRRYEEIVAGIIIEWLSETKPTYSIGYVVFECLEEVALRLSPDLACEICCKFLERHLKLFYFSMTKFISKHIDLRKVKTEIAMRFVACIIRAMENDSERDMLCSPPGFLIALRKQARSLTNELDGKVQEFLPRFYEGEYRLETTESVDTDYPVLLRKYIDVVKVDNKKQGADGTYYPSYGVGAVLSILESSNVEFEPSVLDDIVSTVAYTLTESKESVSVKLNAILLLTFIVLKYPSVYEGNIRIFDDLFAKRDAISSDGSFLFSANINDMALRISMRFLFICAGRDLYSEVLELMPYIVDDIPLINAVADVIVRILEMSECQIFPENVSSMILQNTLQWLRSSQVEIRWKATIILFKLLCYPEYESIINNQLITLIDNDNVYIKNLILRQICKVDGIDVSTKEYIVEKCKMDPNFAVRHVCNEVT